MEYCVALEREHGNSLYTDMERSLRLNEKSKVPNKICSILPYRKRTEFKCVHITLCMKTHGRINIRGSQ